MTTFQEGFTGDSEIKVFIIRSLKFFLTQTRGVRFDEYHKGAGMFERLGFAVFPRLGKEKEGERREREEVERSAGGPSGTHEVKK